MFELPKLNYSYDALEPFIDAKTMEIHHTKHHQAYVDNLNKALKDSQDLASKRLEEILRSINSLPEATRTAIRNNGGGHYNHSFFWKLLKKNEGGKPVGALEDAIDKKFGNFGTFKEEFAKAAMGRFGSGWAWLVIKNDELVVTSTANQDCPVSEGQKVVLGLDVWEHAYYLLYQNKRVDYVANFWNVINWEQAEENYRG